MKLHNKIIINQSRIRVLPFYWTKNMIHQKLDYLTLFYTKRYPWKTHMQTHNLATSQQNNPSNCNPFLNHWSTLLQNRRHEISSITSGYQWLVTNPLCNCKFLPIIYTFQVRQQTSPIRSFFVNQKTKKISNEILKNQQ